MPAWSAGVQSGTRGAQPTPASDAVGVLYFVSDEDVLERWSGSAWVQVAINAVEAPADPTLPTGGTLLTDLTGWTTFGSVTANHDSTVPDCVFLETASQNVVGVYRALPSLPSTLTLRVDDCYYMTNYCGGLGLFLSAGDPASNGIVKFGPGWGDGNKLQAVRYNNAGSWNSTPGNVDHLFTLPYFVRAIVASATDAEFQFCRGGQVWTTVYDYSSLPFTATHWGVCLYASASTATRGSYPWVHYT
jgi:hypothetical protein